MRIPRTMLQVLAAAVFIAGCGGDSDDSTGPTAGDDALVFANSTGSSITVEMSVNGIAAPDVMLDASSTQAETTVDVSFVDGHVYTFQFISASTAIKASDPLTCTVAAAAEADGVASVLVFLDAFVGGLAAQCLQNWDESPT